MFCPSAAKSTCAASQRWFVALMVGTIPDPVDGLTREAQFSRMGTRSPHEASAEVSHPFRTVPLGSDAHGCCFRRTRLISHCNFYQRACRGPLRLRLRIGCGVDLALRAHALADDDAHRGVRAHRARLFGLEAAARAELAQRVAVPARGGVRRPNGRGDPRLRESRPGYARALDSCSSLMPPTLCIVRR